MWGASAEKRPWLLLSFSNRCKMLALLLCINHWLKLSNYFQYKAQRTEIKYSFLCVPLSSPWIENRFKVSLIIMGIIRITTLVLKLWLWPDAFFWFTEQSTGIFLHSISGLVCVKEDMFIARQKFSFNIYYIKFVL